MSKPLNKKIVLSAIFLNMYFAGCNYTDIRAIYKNNQTSKTIKEKSIDESQAGYLKALEIEPLLPALHSNLGTTYEVLKDTERALKLYRNAEDYAKSEIDASESKPLFSKWEKNSLYLTLFAALFNQGQLLGRDKKIDEALSKYQDALALNPNSIEVKTNIELLLQQQQGEGKGDSKEDQSSEKDQQDQKEGKDPKDDQKDKDGDKPKNYSNSPKYKPREFKGELNKENVQKIFGEISQQEKRMRTQFSKQKQMKESPREKDW